ncbi:VOC family protein [Pseudonocardia eucalypti]|uniref:VOC family protein n=1 Tax=Pseudonocardia eucalypti TaxID=648755 RepID=A0ABP9Q139_9PSEU|nr:catechol 2,3-dioxygenase-like lactoylglutathione lyase family enzyme [Pseudonocardia eucalypti]
MINAFSHMCIYVLDQDSAKAFYTEKPGFTLIGDHDMGDGIQWLTVSPPNQPDLEVVLADCRMGHDAETADQLRALVAKGAIGPGVLATDDCQKSYEELSARGVEFLQAPTERFYGTEALLRDDSGNWFSLSKRAPVSGS